MDPKKYLRDPGIIKRGNNYHYIKDNKQVTDCKTLERLNKYRVPPAWKSVWYASSKDSHIQVYGFDGGGKKQYILSENWINNAKYEKYLRMKRFIRDLGHFKKKIALPKNNVGSINKDQLIKLLFNLLIDTHIRVGNECYAEKNGTYGLTTMRQKHVKYSNGKYLFDFVGKSGIKHSVEVPSEWNSYIKRLIIPGSNNKLLFYYDSVPSNGIESEELNDYLRSNMGSDYTCKDFRTYSANVLFIKAFLKNSKVPQKNVKSIKKTILKSISESADQLGHTRSISKKSYISDSLLDYCSDFFSEASGKSVSELLCKVWS